MLIACGFDQNGIPTIEGWVIIPAFNTPTRNSSARVEFTIDTGAGVY